MNKIEMRMEKFHEFAWFRTCKVSFYGISSSTANYGLLIHPKGNKPSYRTNYLELKIKTYDKWSLASTD